MRNEALRNRAAKTLRRRRLGALQSLHPLAQHPVTGLVVRLCGTHGSLVEKSAEQAPPGYYQAQALGLEKLAQSGCVRVPRVLALSDQQLLLEDVRGAPRAAGYWQQLAQALACLQRRSAPAFGFPCDTFCGANRQPNPHEEDGHRFFATHRLRFQGRMALRAGYLQAHDMHTLDTLCEQLARYIPAQPAVLLHGDLWSGNLLSDENGAPCLIDPACYWGWAETDIAMTSLFGGFPERFYDAYQEAAQPLPGWRERIPLYNLYHLLNHLNLFGMQYYPQVHATLSRYAKPH